MADPGGLTARTRAARRRWVLPLVGIVVVADLLLLALVLSDAAPQAVTSEGPRVFAAGNFGSDSDRLARVLDRRNVEAFLTLGNHFGSGSGADRTAAFDAAFGPLASRMLPTPSEDDYGSDDLATYLGYFGRESQEFPDGPYYAVSVGEWRIYSLDATRSAATPDAPMYEWLRRELQARPRECSLAFWHGDPTGRGGLETVWELFAAHGVDISITAGAGTYARLDPVDGITPFVVGTGGGSLGGAVPGATVTYDGEPGALQLELLARSARFSYFNVDERVIDSGEVACHPASLASSAPGQPVGLAVAPAADGHALTWDAVSEGSPIGYLVRRGPDIIGFTAETSFVDEATPSGQGVLYSVIAIDAAGNRSTPSTAVPSAAGAAGFADFTWGPIDQNPSAPTADKPQSKLWWVDGEWWALLWASHDVDRPGYYIMRFDRELQGWTNTGVAADERDRSRADALWVEDRGKLYVASTSSRGSIKLYRYSFEDGAFVADDGYPARVSDEGSESVTLARDSTGRLWMTATKGPDGGPCVEGAACAARYSFTEGTDYQWGPFVDLPFGEATVEPDDISAVVAYGGDHIGIVWSNQAQHAIFFATHADADPPDRWSIELVSTGPRGADDHLNIKASDAGELFVVTKSSENDPSDAAPGLPLVQVHRRTTDGAWASTTVWTVADDVTRPQVALSDSSVYVVAAQPGNGGSIYLKTSPLDAPLAFSPGLGELLLSTGGVNNPTTTKQVVTDESDLLVLASDDEVHTYWHHLIAVDTP